MANTLYVVSAPATMPGAAGAPSDLTRRALQVLHQVSLIVADDDGPLQWLLEQSDLAASSIADGVEPALKALQHDDVALLSTGWMLGLSEPGGQLVRVAIQRGGAVVPIPGPVFPLSALVLSGLPAHSFVWIGEYSQESVDQQSLLARFAHDTRTILAVSSASDLVKAGPELALTLGNRPLVVVTPSDDGADVIWRGMLDQLSGSAALEPVSRRCAWVIGGSQEKPQRWEEDRLRARVETLCSRGQGAREISQQLTKESGWPRREIYKMVVDASESDVRPKEES
jgi:16S rRNA (cytidine1402-2'-O)-methyltransferase